MFVPPKKIILTKFIRFFLYEIILKKSALNKMSILCKFGSFMKIM